VWCYVMNVGVLYSPFDRLSNKEVEHDLKEMGTSVHAALKEAGYDPLLIDLDKTGFDGIQAMKLDLLFNVCERLHGDPAYEPQIASLLEMMGVNITGSSGSTLSVCNNKIMAKAMAQHHGILVPRSQVFSNRGQEYGQALEFPVIIKPASMHNSIGIFKDSLAYTEEDMRKKAGRIIYQYRQPALIEEYIPGRDIEVSILGNNGSAGVLPLVEVFYPGMEDQTQQFFSYESKWIKGRKESGYYREARDIAGAPRARLVQLARRCYKMFSIRDYGRVDFRLGNDGRIYLLEVTANQGLSPGDSTIMAAQYAGMSHAAAILRIFLTAAQRHSLLGKQEAARMLQECLARV